MKKKFKNLASWPRTHQIKSNAIVPSSKFCTKSQNQYGISSQFSSQNLSQKLFHWIGPQEREGGDRWQKGTQAVLDTYSGRRRDSLAAVLEGGVRMVRQQNGGRLLHPHCKVGHLIRYPGLDWLGFLVVTLTGQMIFWQNLLGKMVEYHSVIKICSQPHPGSQTRCSTL